MFHLSLTLNDQGTIYRYSAHFSHQINFRVFLARKKNSGIFYKALRNIATKHKISRLVFEIYPPFGHIWVELGLGCE